MRDLALLLRMEAALEHAIFNYLTHEHNISAYFGEIDLCHRGKRNNCLECAVIIFYSKEFDVQVGM